MDKDELAEVFFATDDEFAGLAGCVSPENETSWKAEIALHRANDQQAREACIRLGGVPETTANHWFMSACFMPPQPCEATR